MNLADLLASYAALGAALNSRDNQLAQAANELASKDQTIVSLRAELEQCRARIAEREPVDSTRED